MTKVLQRLLTDEAAAGRLQALIARHVAEGGHVTDLAVTTTAQQPAQAPAQASRWEEIQRQQIDDLRRRVRAAEVYYPTWEEFVTLGRVKGRRGSRALGEAVGKPHDYIEFIKVGQFVPPDLWYALLRSPPKLRKPRR